ncbi:hypothetical protein Tco_0528340 [Tanacetum coccineum]
MYNMSDLDVAGTKTDYGHVLYGPGWEKLKRCFDFTNDPRMRHVCNWKGHSVVHEDEEAMFYQTLYFHVKNEGSLAILPDFVTTKHLFIFEHTKIVYGKNSYRLKLHREFYNDDHSRVNDMKLIGNWRRILRRCMFGKNKTIRLNYLTDMLDKRVVKTCGQDPVMNVVFHMSYGKLRELSGEEAWETIKSISQGQKEWDNQPNIISEHEIENLKVHAKILFGNENVWVKMDRNITWDKVENSDP